MFDASVRVFVAHRFEKPKDFDISLRVCLLARYLAAHNIKPRRKNKNRSGLADRGDFLMFIGLLCFGEGHPQQEPANQSISKMISSLPLAASVKALRMVSPR